MPDADASNFDVFVPDLRLPSLVHNFLPRELKAD
jgi:hypothetical protein